MVASNTRDCFREFVGQRLIGLLFDALPIGRKDLAAGNTTLVFEGGRGLTLSNKGAYWIDSSEDVKRAVDKRVEQLRQTEAEIREVLATAGVPEGDR